jgi:hypothetical protein
MLPARLRVVIPFGERAFVNAQQGGRLGEGILAGQVEDAVFRWWLDAAHTLLYCRTMWL